MSNILFDPNEVRTNLNFSLTSDALNQGLIAWRPVWLTREGDPVAIYLVAGSEFVVNRSPLNLMFPEGTQVRYRSHVDAVFEVHRTDAGIKVVTGVYHYPKDDTDANDWCVTGKIKYLDAIKQNNFQPE